MGEFFNVAKWTAPGFEEHSTTCDGEMISAPSMRSENECATLCDATVAPVKCMGFQMYDGKMCAMFSSVKKVSYYSNADCAKVNDNMCRIKMSESKGFSAETTKNARCFA